MRILVCTAAARSLLGSCGRRCNTRRIIRYLKKRLHANEPLLRDGGIDIKATKCLMRCSDGPVLLFHNHPAKTWYRYDGEHDIDELICEHVLGGRVVERLLLAESSRPRSVDNDGKVR